MPKVRTTECHPAPGEYFLLDTNILIHLFYPTLSKEFMKKYETIYAQIQKKGAELILSSVQLSEFVNRCIRFQYDLYVKSNSLSKESFDYKKDYRDTPDYYNCMNAILDIIKTDILPHFTLVDDRFDSIDINKILRYGFSYDFNDALLSQIALKYNAAIITHDADFANFVQRNQVIVSDNPKLLMFS